MISWAAAFLVVVAVATIIGFGGITKLGIEVAKLVFSVAIVLVVASAIVHIARGQRTAQ